ncbi:hypothetical protein D9758_005940 [Tetrapyrgos nigripes]|uniref:J domain-containing protein n=1 Tax=Tetrapyrgos nigripes TaxID=182062 RepID=A0A8H5LH72_9AGAR|nr:hypothetical protein D9758_005940 [Tetrapyrgos nigripes]
MVYNTLFGFVGWSIIPDFATRHALNFIHKFYPNIFGVSPPRPGTPAYRQHYRYTFAAVILGYLLYTLIEGSRSMAPNFYEILGVPPDVDENGLKLAFRQFARRYHPDRPGVGAKGAELFIVVRDAFEALKNPTVRFAYDRFGPGVLQWTQLSTPRDYIRHGLLQSSGYHIVSGLALFVISGIGRTSPVKFWRYLLFFTILASELAFLLYPSPSPSSSILFPDPANGLSYRTIFHLFFPNRVPYQHILFLHQMFVFLSVALTRVAPQLFPEESSQEQEAIMQQILALAGYSDREASIMLHTELHSIHPFTPETRISASLTKPRVDPDQEIMDQLAAEMENMIIESNLKKDSGPLRSAWDNAVKKARSRSKSLSAMMTTMTTPTRAGKSEKGKATAMEKPSLESEEDGRDNSPGSAVDGEGRLPSPRPSPPPSIKRKGSSYMRARSISY